MARFIQPAELDYIPQYTPLPLEFLSQKVKTEQTGLEKAEDTLYQYKAGVKGGMRTRDLAGEVNKKIRQQAEEIAPALESGDWRGALSKLKRYNSELQKDPMYRILQGDYEYIKNAQAVYKEALEKGNLGQQKWFDPLTGDVKQITPEEAISLGEFTEGLYGITPFKDPDALIDQKFREINAFVKGSTGEDIANLKTDATGRLMYQTTTGTVKFLDENKDIDNRIKSTVQELENILESQYTPEGKYFQEARNQGLINPSRYPTTKDFILDRFGKFRQLEQQQGVTYTGVPTDDGGGTTGGITTQVPGGFDYDISDYGGDVTKLNLSDITKDIQNSEQVIKQYYNNADQEMYKGLQAAFNGEAPGFLNLINKNEQTVDNILTEAIKQTPASDTNRIKNLQAIVNDPNTLRNMLTDPLTAFGKGGKLNLMLGEANTQKLKKEFYKGMLELSQNPTNQNDATVSSNFLTHYNQGKELERLNEQKNAIVESALKQSLGDKKEDVRLYQLGTTAASYFSKDANTDTGVLIEPVYNDKSIQNDPVLKKLKDEKMLVPKKGSPGIYHFDAENPNSSYAKAVKILDKVNNDLKEGKITIATQRRVISEITPGDKPGKMGSYEKGIVKKWNDDGGLLLKLIQASSTGLDPQHQNSLKDAFGASPVRDEGFEFGEGSKITGFVFDVSPSGLPMMYVTAKDKQEKKATLEVKFDKNDKFQLATMIGDMASDDDPSVREVAANWFAALNISENNLGLVNLFFDSGVNDKAKPVPTSVYFSDDSGTKYGLSVDKFGKTTLGLATNNIGADGKPIIQPFTIRKTIGGQDIDPNNVTSFSEVLTLIGTYNINKLNPGVQGGDTEKKSPLLPNIKWTAPQ